MGFIKEVYSSNRAGLVVAFGRGESSENYYNGSNVEDAMKYFNMYLKNDELFIKTEDATALDTMGIQKEEATEIRSALDDILSIVADEDVENVKVLFPQWKEEVAYSIGQRVRFGDNVYKVLQAHTSQSDWTPDVAVSLFAALLVDEESNQIQEWIQPDSTNAYMIGDRVLFQEKTYESLIDDNVWSPSDYPTGWKEIVSE